MNKAGFHGGVRDLVARTQGSVRVRDLMSVAVAAVACLFALMTPRAWAAQEVVLVPGHAGEARYGVEIDAAVGKWKEGAQKGGAVMRMVGTREDGGAQIERLRKTLEEVVVQSGDPLWLVLLGHGSAQGNVPRFQLEGADVSAEELSKMLGRLRRPVIVVAGFSSSGAFLKPLSAPGRVVVTATRSGGEENWSRFGRFFAEAVCGLEGDADEDGQVSVWEAWQHAKEAVEAFYKGEGRICTEHALLDDTGGGKAGGAGNGLKARQWHLLESAAEAALSAEERNRRELLEAGLERLRETKAKADPAEYAKALEQLLLELAKVYEAAR